MVDPFSSSLKKRKTPRQEERRLSSLPAVVRRLRKASGLTLPQIAEQAGLSKITILKIEKGQKIPSWKALCRLLEALQGRQFLFLAIVLKLHLQENPSIFEYGPEAKAFTVFGKLRRLLDEGCLDSPGWREWRAKLARHSEEFGSLMGLSGPASLAIYDACIRKVDPEESETKLVATTFVSDLERWAASVLVSSEIDFDALLNRKERNVEDGMD